MHAYPSYSKGYAQWWLQSPEWTKRNGNAGATVLRL